MMFPKSLLAVACWSSVLSSQFAAGAPLEQPEVNTTAILEAFSHEDLAHHLEKRQGKWNTQEERPWYCRSTTANGWAESYAWDITDLCQKYQVGDNCCIIALKSSFRFDLFEDDWIDMQNAVGKQSNKDSIRARTSEGIWTAFYKMPFGAHDKLPANVLQHWFAIITKVLPNTPEISYSSETTFFWNKGDQTNEMVVGKKPRR